ESSTFRWVAVPESRVLGCASIALRPLAAALQIARTGGNVRDLRSSMALPLAEPTPLHRRDSDVSHLAPHRIKRCTYRRLISIERPAERLYEVECLYPD